MLILFDAKTKKYIEVRVEKDILEGDVNKYIIIFMSEGVFADLKDEIEKAKDIVLTENLPEKSADGTYRYRPYIFTMIPAE